MYTRFNYTISITFFRIKPTFSSKHQSMYICISYSIIIHAFTFYFNVYLIYLYNYFCFASYLMISLSILAIQLCTHHEQLTTCLPLLTLRWGYFNHALRQVATCCWKTCDYVRPSIRKYFHWWTDFKYFEMGRPALMLIYT